MLQRLSILSGVFMVMALSNAIVPVLPHFAEGSAFQGAIFSAYFFGAFLTVLPAGMFSDRVGRVLLMRAGLVLTLLAGVMLAAFPVPAISLAARVIEGVGAGLFVPVAMSWVSSQKDYERMSGYFMASLNLGLLLGLFGTGWIASWSGDPVGGTILFTGCAVLPLALSAGLSECTRKNHIGGNFFTIVRQYFWLFASGVILIGVTGVVTTLYPEFTGESPATLALQIGVMNIATIIAVVAASHLRLEPVRTIRIAAIAMACAVLATFFHPLGFAMVGAVAGFVIISQMIFLARTNVQQGVMMGLFNAASYGGMTLLPFLAGVIAEYSTFFIAFLAAAAAAAFNAFTIHRCECRYKEGA